MRQTHVAGERLFVDYAGTTLDVIDGSTGEAMPAQLFVAALGASNYTYAEATWTQGLADWIGSHTRVFAFIGAVSAMVVSDNLKSGIAKACFYEPAVNRTYAEMAAHYDTAIVPALAVQVATRFIIAKLRNRPQIAMRVDDVAAGRTRREERAAASEKSLRRKRAGRPAACFAARGTFSEPGAPRTRPRLSAGRGARRRSDTNGVLHMKERFRATNPWWLEPTLKTASRHHAGDLQPITVIYGRTSRCRH